MKTYANRVIAFLFENSLFLIIGAVAALFWANINHETYEHIKHLVIIKDFPFGTLHADGTRTLDFHFLVNDILMSLFFAISGKEVWEATLPGGPLSNPKRAAVPILAAVGGMAAPALIYLFGAHLIGQFSELS